MKPGLMYNFSILVDDGVAGDLQSKIEICSRLNINIYMEVIESFKKLLMEM